jgi:hypothetical protein
MTALRPLLAQVYRQYSTSTDSPVLASTSTINTGIVITLQLVCMRGSSAAVYCCGLQGAAAAYCVAAAAALTRDHTAAAQDSSVMKVRMIPHVASPCLLPAGFLCRFKVCECVKQVKVSASNLSHR